MSTATVQDTEQYDDPCALAHYAEGVYRAVTAQPVLMCEPRAKQVGYAAACNGMAEETKRMWYDYCVKVYGYVDPMPHWSDNPQYSATLTGGFPMTTNTAVAVRPQAPVQAPTHNVPVQGQNVPVLDFSAIPPHVMARAAQIAADVLAQEGGKINPAQALSAAYHFENTGEVYGRHSYVGTKGNVAGRVLEGYRAVSREFDMSKYQWRYRPLTGDEEKLNCIQPGDRALICELDVLAARRQCIEMKIEYQPVIGCTVIRKGETLNIPKNRSSLWVMQKQARVDALRQVGENTEGDEVLAEAGVTDAPEGYMSIEQAEAMVRERIAEAMRAAAQPLTPQELQARLAANTAVMRAPQGFQGFGDEPEPGGTTEHAPLTPHTIVNVRETDPALADTVAPGNGHAPEAEPTDAEFFEQIPSASQERAEAEKHDDATMAVLDGAVAVKFSKWCGKFAEAYPSYRKDGKADMFHVLKAVKAEQFSRITTENVNAVCDALKARAEAKVNGKEIAGK